jgi:hypothetical protein
LLAALAPFRAQSQQSSGTLAGFLSKQGLGGAKLERRFGNHLFVPVFAGRSSGCEGRVSASMSVLILRTLGLRRLTVF